MRTLLVLPAFMTLASCLSGPHPAPVAVEPHVRAWLADPSAAQDPQIAALLAPSPLAEPTPGVHRAPSTSLPLAGVRVAIDPGHMGGAEWDERTGKYIIDEEGHRLSEGELALELSLLVEKKLKALGAHVDLTRRAMAPVTNEKYTDARANEFLSDDLKARGDVLRADKPDVVLILHFDESTPANDHLLSHLPRRCNDTKAYVVGAFSKDDLKAPDAREQFREIAQAPRTWDRSVDLSRDIVDEISTTAHVPFAEATPGKTVALAPGVFSRNLRVSRELAGVISSYVEVLCYEDPAQLKALLPHDHAMTISGRKYFYSDRLEALADAITRGLSRFETQKQL